MAFAVIRVGFKPKLFIIEWTINAETYRRNIETLAFMDELDQLHGPLQGIFRQDEGPDHTARRTMAWTRLYYAGWMAVKLAQSLSH
jgi:hypothetical protein